MTHFANEGQWADGGIWWREATFASWLAHANPATLSSVYLRMKDLCALWHTDLALGLNAASHALCNVRAIVRQRSLK